MQQIPSPNVSTTELPISSTTQEVLTDRDLTRVSETNAPSLEEHVVRGELNGDSATPAFKTPALPNGNRPAHTAMEPQQLPADSIETKIEVSVIFISIRPWLIEIRRRNKLNGIRMVSTSHHLQLMTYLAPNKRLSGKGST